RRCNRPCRKTLRLREGTIFSNWRRVSLSNLFFIMYLWSEKISCARTTAIVNVKKDHVIAMYQLLREVCMYYLQRNPIRVGGGGAHFVVQIDESQFHHRQRGGVGRVAQAPVWVFGLADTRFVPAKGYMAIVPNRNRRTLTAIINQVLNANSIIHSDQWRAYINLPQFVQNCVGHETVNHTNHFVDPLTGAHTQNIESYWNRFKLKIKAMKGIRRADLQSYMDEFMWRDWYGLDQPLDNIIAGINHDYPQT
uniref:ISXO2-like transposase domain-containing protein n=1 Tax=Clytia hemisphaerica TaxID=252671 RepID=A0A7M5VCQ3_9CNID